MRSTRIALVASIVVLSACKKAPPPPPPMVMHHSCRVALHARPAPELSVSAAGNGTTREAATEAAWTAVCARLPEAQRGSCRDASRFSPSEVVASMASGGVTNYTVTINLSPQPGDDSRGNGTSTTSNEDACHQAIEQACRAAGATGDCVAAGTHEISSRSSTSQLQ